MRVIRKIQERDRQAPQVRAGARRDPPTGVSPTVFAAALALAAALFLPQLAAGRDGAGPEACPAPAAATSPALPAPAL
jgi:hypothetical protein